MVEGLFKLANPIILLLHQVPRWVLAFWLINKRFCKVAELTSIDVEGAASSLTGFLDMLLVVARPVVDIKKNKKNSNGFPSRVAAKCLCTDFHDFTQ